jgi:uncharacterized RDD family membrane protein YckC
MAAVTESTPSTPPAGASQHQPADAGRAGDNPPADAGRAGDNPPAVRGPYIRPPYYAPPPPPPYGYGYGPVPPRGYFPVAVSPDGRPLAGFGDRILAYLLDMAIQAAAAMIFVIPAFIWWILHFTREMQTLTTSNDRSAPVPDSFTTDFLLGYFALVGVIIVVSIGITYVYEVEMAWRSGQTIGKRVMKLAAAPVEPGVQRTRMMFVKRWAVQRIVGQLVPFFTYLDGLWQLWDKPLQQCLHDKAAQTVVVKIG